MIDHSVDPNLLVRLNKKDFIRIVLTEENLKRVEYLANKTMMNDHEMKYKEVYSSKMAEVAYEIYFGIEEKDLYSGYKEFV